MHIVHRDRNIELPTSISGRLGLGAACLVLLPPSAVFLYGFHFVAPPWPGLAETVFRCIVEMLCLAFVLFSLLGLTWAIATPRWVGVLFQEAAAHLSVALLIFCLFCLPFALWAIWKA
jgi:hypothetical protein